MRRSFARLAAVAGGALLTACTLLVDTSDLHAPELGSPGAPQSTLDGAALDGTALDATPDSSTRDGAVAADGAPLPFCASLSPVPAFCEDFDGVTPPTGWNSTLSPGATLATDDLASASPPRSLRATLPNPTAAPCKYASQTRDFSLPFATRVRFGFSIRIGRVGQSGGVPNRFVPAELRLSDAEGGGQCGYYFVLGATGGTMSTEGAATQAYALSPASAVAPGTWVRVELVVEKAGQATLTFDGKAGLENAQLPAACKFDRVSQLDLGLVCFQPGSGDGDLRIDDVAIQTQ